MTQHMFTTPTLPHTHTFSHSDRLLIHTPISLTIVCTHKHALPVGETGSSSGVKRISWLCFYDIFNLHQPLTEMPQRRDNPLVSGDT